MARNSQAVKTDKLHTTTEVHIQIKQLRNQLKELYRSQIIQIQKNIKRLNTSLSQTRQKNKQLQQERLKINRLLKIKPSTSSKQQLRKTHNAIIQTDKALKNMESQLQQARQLLQQNRTELNKYKIEARVMAQFNKNWRQYDSQPKPAQPKNSVEPMILPKTHNLILADHLAVMHISHPPIPTDGPDQPQGEVEIISLSFNEESTAEHELVFAHTGSPFANYLSDDDLDDEST